MNKLRIHRHYLWRNPCFVSPYRIEHQIKGIMLHSTGEPGTPAKDWYYRWNNPYSFRSYHYFVDWNGVWNYLPSKQNKTYRARHCGSGIKGSGNLCYLSIALCEPVKGDSHSFKEVWQHALILTASLLKSHNLDEITPMTVLSHYEGYQSELASFHRDPEDFFSSYGKTMEDFRIELSNILYSLP